ncbi:MAG TPA: hypothetical protein VF780_01715, partial [Nitrosospira sp.]
MCDFWGAGQGATTRNGATAQGGAVPFRRKVRPRSGMLAPQRTISAAGHPRRCPIPTSRGPSGDALGAPHSKELQRSHVPQKSRNLPCS